MGAQHRRVGGARRAALVVGPAAGQAHARRRPGSCSTRTWSRTGFRDDEQADRWRARAAGWLTDYVTELDPTDEPVGTERTVGATTERLALSGPHRPDRPARRRAGGRRLQDRPGALAPRTRRAGHRRWRSTCSGVRRTLRRAVHPGRAAPPAHRHGRRLRAHRAVAGQPRAPGRGHRRRHRGGHRGAGRRGRTRTWPSRRSPDSSAAGATSGPAARPARPPSRRGRPGASSPRRRPCRSSDVSRRWRRGRRGTPPG